MIKVAAVIGAGVMGKGIARHLDANGCEVILIESDIAQLADANIEMIESRVRLSKNMADCYEADYVVEAVNENLGLKQDLFAKLTPNLAINTIIASNTSSLLIRDLASAVTSSERFLGVHYNNPADLNPIVEIIPTEATTPHLIQKLTRWYQDSGKQTVVCKDTTGFILNRQSLPYINEAVRCLDTTTPGAVDAIAIRELGVGLGPFAVMNMVGLKVMAASSKNLALLGSGYSLAELLQQKAAEEEPRWLIELGADLQGVDIAAIKDRLLGAMLFPGKDILDQSLCNREDLHFICVEALGYKHSSPELLSQLPKDEIQRLLVSYRSSESG